MPQPPTTAPLIASAAHLDAEALPSVPRRALRRRECVGCREEVVIPLWALDPVECDGCGLDYDPRTHIDLAELPEAMRRAGRPGPKPKREG